MAALDLPCCAWALAVMSRGYSLAALYWLLIAKLLLLQSRLSGMQPPQLRPLVSVAPWHMVS